MCRARLLHQFGVSLTDAISHQLSLPMYSHINTDIKRLATLDDHIQQFLHDKGYSLRDCLHLIHHSPALISRLITDAHYFSFSKRSFDQCVSMSAELMKRHRWSLADFLSEISYSDLVVLNQSPQIRYQGLHQTLTALASPTLLAHRQSINEDIDTLHQQSGIRITYDESLEHVDIEVKKTIQSTDDVQLFAKQLQSADTTATISGILEQL